MEKIVSQRDQIDFLLSRRFGTLAPPPPSPVGGLSARAERARISQGFAMAGEVDPTPSIDRARLEYDAMPASEIQRLVDEAHAEMERAWEQEQSRIGAMRSAAWPAWAKQDLWSHTELAELCCGRVPGEPNRSDLDQIAINRAAETIARGTHAGMLQFVPRDDADTAARMYGTHRHYVPAIAAEWAVARFDSFPFALLDAIRAREGSKPVTALTTQDEKPLAERERVSLLRIIRALDAMATLPPRGAASPIETQLQTLGFTGPGDSTIRKVIEQARALEPDGNSQ